MTQLTQQSQIHYKPEVCTDNSEILISKKQKRSRFVTIAQVLVLFSLISFAHTAISAISDEDLLIWTNNLINEAVTEIRNGKKHRYGDILQLVTKHFPLGPNSISTGQILDLKAHFASELAKAGISESRVKQLADWFESALDQFN